MFSSLQGSSSVIAQSRDQMCCLCLYEIMNGQNKRHSRDCLCQSLQWERHLNCCGLVPEDLLARIFRSVPENRQFLDVTVHNLRQITSSLWTSMSSSHKVLMKTNWENTGLPWWLSGKESACQCKRHGFHVWVGKIPKKEMATHSCILAWRIPWIEEPDRLQSMGSQKSQTQLSN